MALIHRATLEPSKLELVQAWLASKSWAPEQPISPGVSYRLDDPAGEVGLEGLLFSVADGSSVHVPLTYRGRPLDGGETHLLGTMEHSVLGTRWVYDGCGDPVWATALASTILSGGVQADEIVDGAGPREPKVRVRGSGQLSDVVISIDAVQVSDGDSTTTISGGLGDLVVVRRIGTDPDCDQILTAFWGPHVGGVPLAGLRMR